MIESKEYQYSFWVVFIVLSIISGFFSYQYFDQVTPIVQLSITVDKDDVLNQAVSIASQLQIPLDNYQHAVEFQSDTDLQSFVELEAGGKKSFIDMFQSGIYQPYQWKVRFFKEQQVEELFIYFSPQGLPLGFYQKVSEMLQGAALSKAQALHIVEKNIEQWCPDYQQYQLVEYNSEHKDTGRIDHTFIYERTDLTIGKGKYRFKVVVTGDCITTLQAYIKIPDEFHRRYKEMRSANELLAFFGTFILKLVYLFILALFGMIYLYHRNYLSIRSSCIAAFIVALGELCNGFNQYQLWWLSYNTVQSSIYFILMRSLFVALQFLLTFSIIFLALVAAEAAGRFVYKQHIQFFKILDWSVLTSYELFQQICIGYLSVSFMFGYEILYTYITEHYFSWWTPAASLSDPNILTSVFPWLSPITISLQAGFMEEVLFRALPLAMISLMTYKYKDKKIWFWIAFMMQALIFGACHANYPNQPFYTRLVELIIPSFGFGFLYYRFGLIPGALCHYVYDAILFALPIFVSNSLPYKIMVIGLITLPLWILLAIIVYNQGLHTLSFNFYNQNFHPDEYIPVVPEPRKIGMVLSQKNYILAMICGLLGIGFWFVSDGIISEVGPLYVSKNQAITYAQNILQKEFNVDLSAWDVICTVQDDISTTESRFIWQTYGKEVYQNFEGSYIQGVSWLVRFVQFNRLVEDRSEEFRVVVSNCCRLGNMEPKDTAPQIISVEHIIPEYMQGADLSEEQVLIILYKYIQEAFNIEKQEIAIISIESDKVENRRNWTIVVQDLEFFDFNQEGQARIKIIISGDKVTAYQRFIFVPESWTRSDQAFLMNISMFKIVLYLILLLFMLFGCVLGIKKLAVSRYGIKILRDKVLFILGLVTVVSINNFCMYLGYFNTAEPFYDQTSRIILQLILSNIWQIFFYSVFLTIAAVGFIKSKIKNYIISLMLGMNLGLFLAGIHLYLQQYDMVLQPHAGNFVYAGAYIPGLSFLGALLSQYCLVVSLLIAMFLLVKQVHYKISQFVIMFLFYISLQGLTASQSIEFMLIQGAVYAIIMYVLYDYILQYDMTILPIIVAIQFVIIHCFAEMLYPSYLGASLHAFMTSIAIIIVSLFFYHRSHIE